MRGTSLFYRLDAISSHTIFEVRVGSGAISVGGLCLQWHWLERRLGRSYVSCAILSGILLMGRKALMGPKLCFISGFVAREQQGSPCSRNRVCAGDAINRAISTTTGIVEVRRQGIVV